MAASTTPAPVEETLAWEAQWAPRAAATAIVAGLFTLGGTVLQGAALRSRPSVTLSQGLHDAATPNNPHGLLEPTLAYVDRHMALLTIGQVLTALAAPLTALALIYLFRAVRARQLSFGQGALIAVAIGGVASLVGILVGQIAVDISVSNFVSAADHSTQAAHDALQPPIAIAAGLIQFVGHVALGLGFVLIALNAMRVGLLTRFMGVLGMITGALQILPIGGPLPVVQAFWLIMLSVLFLGRWPNGQPPAWASGKAEPWPSSADVRAQRQKAMAARRGEAPPDDAEPAEAEEPVPANGPSPSTSATKRKRKRR